VVPLILFCDDVSGNISKKWNKFDIWAMMLAGLPRKVNSRLDNIHFLCASNNVGCLQMAKPLVDDLVKLEKEGLHVYDAYLEHQSYV